MSIAIVGVGLVLLGIASIIVAVVDQQPVALISAALAFGSIFVGLFLKGSLNRMGNPSGRIE